MFLLFTKAEHKLILISIHRSDSIRVVGVVLFD